MDRINAQTRVIAVMFPNTSAAGEGVWGSHWVSVDNVEKQTSQDLLSNVPESMHRIIEATVDREVYDHILHFRHC